MMAMMRHARYASPFTRYRQKARPVLSNVLRIMRMSSAPIVTTDILAANAPRTMHGNTKQHLSLCMARCVCSASTPRPDDRSSIETFFRGQSCPRCVSVEAAATKWDEGRPARRRSTRLYHLRTMLSFFPSPVFASSAHTKATKGDEGGSQNSAPQGAQSGELDQRHTMSFHQCRQSATNCRHISVAPVAQSLTIQSHRGCPISASLLSTGDRGGRDPGGTTTKAAHRSAASTRGLGSIEPC